MHRDVQQLGTLQRGGGCSPIPLPPGHHLVDADEEAGKQVPEAVEEAGDHAAKGQVGGDVHRHHTIEPAINLSQTCITPSAAERVFA